MDYKKCNEKEVFFETALFQKYITPTIDAAFWGLYGRVCHDAWGHMRFQKLHLGVFVASIFCFRTFWGDGVYFSQNFVSKIKSRFLPRHFDKKQKPKEQEKAQRTRKGGNI